MRKLTDSRTLLAAAATLALAACGKQEAPPPAPAAAAQPTAAEADAFVAGVNDDYRKLLPYLNAAQWAQSTYITDDTQLLASRANEEWLEYLSGKVQEAKRFNGVEMSPDTQRGMMQLKLSTANPAPSDPTKRAELAKILSKMEANYGSGKWCRSEGDCLTLPEIEKIINDPNATPEAREQAWAGWHATSKPIKADYQRFVELGNEGAKELGFADLGEMWRAGYDMTPAEFDTEVERLWTQVRPLYEALHCNVRAKLNAKYGDDVVPKDGLIPAHLLGNMWAQQWGNIYPLVEPYAGVGSLDVDSALRARRDDEYKKLVGEFKGRPTSVDLAELEHKADAAMAVKMSKISEDFYTSLGFPALPESFYEKSLLVQPRDRDVVCHASAWDMNMQGDVRIKECIEPTSEHLETIHHEMGHIYYYLMYNGLPPLFQTGAHDGFHEAIGDTMTLSLTPAHLNKIGLVPEQTLDEKSVINAQMKLALDKIVFLPWGKLVDQWRWKVFSGEITPDHYNEGWWKLREAYQGVAAPLARSEDDFDPGAKYHIPGNTPYTRYFLSFVIQFQFQKALCEAAGFDGPLNECDIYSNKEAGKKFMDMLAQGASKPWQDTLEKLTGSREMDGSALIEYFAPLMSYLAEQNKGLSCGWDGEK
ncbi:M2 family metallopeptidase [Sinimarinibacterium sp. CAU 1509]|uniref:M2 family metallopeptidase n=1 Tax=Sinimarinibacterium sp. CAU 1509 TaxID=2562283 RepID=UPI0010AC2732|nr:M2 family metallopeptidase [Sinimarinibacterium sp. CAU 1509]TJY59779.1 M2 family metallopeptidase [Sinimarinibacterium sp. CAU 1509]